MAKYFATSLAILNVVNDPRVISICLPVSTTSINFVGLESKSTMLPASLAAGASLAEQIAQVGSAAGAVAAQSSVSGNGVNSIEHQMAVAANIAIETASIAQAGIAQAAPATPIPSPSPAPAAV